MALAQQYTISTYAGGGPQPPSMGIGFISSIATDGTGNLYFSSVDNSCTCVFKLDPSGKVTRIAGGKTAGFSGDGGPATQALLNDPVGLAVDSAGNLYIAEAVSYNVYYANGQPQFTPVGGFHERVRKVSPNGMITTVAGGGAQGFSGDGGPATSASFFGLRGLAVDPAGNLYIADSLYDDGWDAPVGNNRIRKVTPDGIINTIAGTGDQGLTGDWGPAVNAQLNGPQALTVDNSGNLFFSDLYNSRIRELSIDGTISTVVDLGSQLPNCVSTSNSYQFCAANSTALDPSGNLVFSCNCYSGSPDNAVLTRSPNGAIATVLAANITLEIGLAGPIAIDAAGNLWFSGGWPGPSPSLQKVSPDGTLTVAAGGGSCCGGDGGPVTSAVLQHVNGVAADASGNLFIADANNRRIRDVMPGGIITTVAGSGGLNINCDVLSVGTFSPATATELCLPSEVAVDGAGDIFIVDRNRIRKVTPDGAITSIAGDGTIGFSSDGAIAAQAQLAYPNSVAVDAAGNVYFAEWSRVRKITPDGMVTTVAGTTARAGNNNGCSPPASPGCGPPPVGDGQPATSVQLFGPTSAAVDSRGNLYFVDGPRIRQVTPDGIITTVAGNGGRAGYQLPTGDGGLAINVGLWSPNGVTVDSAGNLYISEPVRIRKVTTDGIINTIAGTQEPGYSGDGGQATQAQLWNPTGLTVDGAWNVYVADSFNNVIRVLRPAQ
jgi:sugar lactone lactonase YvrE